MPVSKQKRARRAELQQMRRMRCVSCHVRNCPQPRCKYQTAVDFYSRRRGKGGTRSEASPDRLEYLFRLIRNSNPYEIDKFLDAPIETIPANQPPSDNPPPAAANPRQMTIRERIALGVPANVV